jgi:predicted NBD/HSP70 family sugar kinase
MTITGDQKLLKRINRMALVRNVRAEPEISRAELAQRTGLTKSTVSQLIDELIAEGWLCERKRRATGALGRRPTPLEWDNTRLALIGAEVGVEVLTLVVTTLSGEVLWRFSDALPEQPEPDAVLDLLVQRLIQAAQEVTKMQRHLLGFGVGVPGAINPVSSVLYLAPNLGWRDVAMREPLATRLKAAGYEQIPIFVRNEADVAALGEFEFGEPPVPEPLVYVSLGVGVGAGVVLNDRLFSGAQGMAGEVGHTVLQMNGPLCSCGRLGCTEAFIGLRAMGAAAAPQGQALSLLQLCQNLEQHHALTQTAVETAGKYLGVLLQNLWMTFNPARIVLGGPSCNLGIAFTQTARQALSQFGEQSGLLIPEVQLSRFGSDAVAVGAAALVLHSVIRPIYGE